MLIAGVLCMSAAVVSMVFGLWALTRSPTGAPAQPMLRAVAPAQLAAAVMLAAGGVVTLARPPQGAVMVLVICVVGAVGTLAAGSWQSARYAVRHQAAASPAPSCCGDRCTCSQPQTVTLTLGAPSISADVDRVGGQQRQW